MHLAPKCIQPETATQVVAGRLVVYENRAFLKSVMVDAILLKLFLSYQGKHQKGFIGLFWGPRGFYSFCINHQPSNQDAVN